MDLRACPNRWEFSDEDLSLWWYQPYIFSNDVASGIAPSWFIKGVDKPILTRAQDPKNFERFWRMSYRMGSMYQDWVDALCRDSKVDLKQASAFELACNTGYFLYALKQRGIQSCVGIDKADLDKQRRILNDVTNIHDIDFRKGLWLPETHAIEGLGDEELFDLVVSSAFMLHISDPLHLLRELSYRTKKALLLHTTIGHRRRGITIRDRGMTITYNPEAHHQKWGDRFPNGFDTVISKELLIYSLRECGFQKIVELKYSRRWLPRKWYKSWCTLVCLK